MDDKEKIKAAIIMLKQLKKMVGFFMKKEIAELIEKLERPSVAGPGDEGDVAVDDTPRSRAALRDDEGVVIY